MLPTIKSYNFDKLIDNTCTLNGVFSKDLIIEKANKTWSEHLKYPISEIVNRNFKDFFYNKTDAIKIHKLLEQNDIITGLTIHLVDKYGNPFWIKCNIGKDGDKIIMLAIDISTDVFNNQTLERVSDVVHVGGWSFNPETDETFWSQELYNILEISDTSKLTRNSIRQYIHPNYLQKFNDAVDKMYGNHQGYDIILKIITGTGQRKWIQLITEPEVFNGKINFIYGILKDVTKIQKTTIEVHELKETMEMALKGMQSGYFIHYLDTNKVSYSQSFRDIIGIDDHIEERVFRSHIHPDDAENAYEMHLSELKKENNLYFNNYRLKNAKGTYKYYEVHGWKIKDDSGNFYKMIGNLIDVNERIVSQLNAKTYISQIETLLQNGRMSSVLLDKDLNILMADQVSTQFFKEQYNADLSTDNINFRDVVPENEKEGFKKDLEKIMNGEKVIKEIKHVYSNGKASWFDLSYLPIINKQNEIEGFVMNFLNITQRVKALQALEKAKYRLTESVRLKDNIINNMHHEIRTPISGILGTTELLESLVTDDEQKELLTFQKTSANRLLSTLNSLINFSELKARTYPFLSETIDLKNLLIYCYASVEDYANQNDVKLSLINFKEHITLTTDRLFLRQSLLNIIDNAVKFSPKGNVELKGVAFKNYAAIIVKDDGIGIEEKEQERIFNSFEQEYTGLNRKFEGNGIGLAFSKKFIESVGGNIKLKSEKEQGSTFTVILPYDLKKIDDDD